MKYIKITNDVDIVNRIYLEKLGLSTKRDDANTIGQFGSGSKFAPIAALRNGWEWINVGADESGQYQMEYVSEEENGINSIFYKYTIDGEVTLKPSSFTLEAGILSWDDNFQIFREAFANALDENISNDVQYSVSVVDEIEYEQGKFSVYITADPSLVKIVDNFDYWFDINRDPIFASELGSVYEPLSNDIRIYHKGVFVYGKPSDTSNDNYESLFDYSLSNITLNEERRVRDTFYAAHQVASLLSDAFTSEPDDDFFEEAYLVCKKVINNLHNNSLWEFSHFVSYYFSDHMFHNEENSALYHAWRDIYGDNSVIVHPDQKNFVSTLKSIYNRNPVVINAPIMLNILAFSGVKTVQDVLGDEMEFDIIDLISGPKKEMLSAAIDIVSKYDERIQTRVDEIKIFHPNNQQVNLLGAARGETIYLSVSTLEDLYRTIGTLIHELDHVVTGYSDDDRGFRSLADDRIAKLVLEKYGE